jgi:hypothetical protein
VWIQMFQQSDGAVSDHVAFIIRRIQNQTRTL